MKPEDVVEAVDVAGVEAALPIDRKALDPVAPGGPPISRRDFFRSLLGNTGRAGVGIGVLGGFLGLRHGHEEPAGMRGELGIVRPPGSVEEPDFLARCIRCTRCADACPTQCIRFFGPEAGESQATPYILTADTACSMCLECGKACPTEAIEVVELMTDVAMGTAEVDERLCVSHNGTGMCGACHTICPLRNRAIVQDYRNAPVVDPEHCTGCGLCEEICIVRDRRAIRVRTSRVHGAEGEEAVS
ncbi:MAG: 4Fe-4S dicluster domain-containing protein [Myxococcales bacterium]|nr:MAG: 4Fe-4S dicluster domain-containing protein [Myxococcales bacterium]